MDLSTYQKRATETAIYPERVKNPLDYTIIGLCGEAGELANKLKKVHRDYAGVLTLKVAESMKAELADVLWYVAAVATELRCDLSEVATQGLDKQVSRQLANTQQGSGDDR